VHLGIVIAVVVIVSGWAAQRGFRWKRQKDAFARHLEERDLATRRHHFRGALDVELEPGPMSGEPPVAGTGDPAPPPGPTETG
jgi:hypothetical protein